MRLDEIENMDLSALTTAELQNILYIVHENAENECHQIGIDYNLKDIDLVNRINESMGLIDLVYTMAYKAGVNYSDTLGTTAIWDSIINRRLYDQKICIFESEQNVKENFSGGYVKSPIVGFHDWVVSFDVNSLYPNLIVEYNISPETLVYEPGHPNNVDYWLNRSEKVDSQHSVAANGSTYRKDFQGILPQIIKDYYAERKTIKSGMIDLKKQYEQHKSDLIKVEIQKSKNSEQAIKYLLNSLYGAMGNPYFRHFDLKMAEGITLSGQLTIRTAERFVNEAMNKLLKTEDVDYVIAIDTDSLYVNFGDLVKKFNPKNPVKFLDKVCQEHFMKVINDAMGFLHEKQNCYERRLVMGREVIADKGIWTAKKRYILNVHNSEGVQYAEPELKIMGIEAIKSSTPMACRNAFEQIFKIILTGDESKTQSFIKKFKSDFMKLKPHEIAQPRGVTEVDQYVDKITVYKKGTPINSKAAIIYNNALKQFGVDEKYEKISSGTKMKYIFLKKPNPVKQEVIGFVDFMPEEFGMEQYIDYNTQFEKTFLEPLTLILDAVKWLPEPRISLEDFFA